MSNLLVMEKYKQLVAELYLEPNFCGRAFESNLAGINFGGRAFLSNLAGIDFGGSEKENFWREERNK